MPDYVIRTGKRAQVRKVNPKRGSFHALVAATNTPYRISAAGEREVIRSGAFSGVSDTLPVFWAHNASVPPVGVTTSCWEERDGLHVRGKVYTDSEAGKAVYRALRDEAVTGWSIGFRPITVRERGDLAEVLEADLREVSVVLMPANPGAETIDVRTGYGDIRRRHGRDGRPVKGFGDGDPDAKRAVRIAVKRAQYRLGVSTRDAAFWRLWDDSSAFRRLVSRATGA